MAPAGPFLQQSGQALTAATKCLRFALLQDLQRDRKAAGAQNRHQVRYRGTLLAVGSRYDSSDPDGFYNAMSADCTLGRIAFWARTGFHPDVFGSLIGAPDKLQPQIDVITSTLAAYEGKQISKTDTLQTFMGLAYHMGVAAVAARSDTSPDAFTAAELERFIQRNLVRSTAFDVLQIGAPHAAETLVGAIIEVLDYMYIAMHGDMAFLLGCWVNAFEMDSFATDKVEIEVFHPVKAPAFTFTPPFRGLQAAFPTPPQFPEGNIGQQPTLTLQETVYRRWEELARGPAAREGIKRRREDAEIGKWLAEKPSASPPSWPLPVFDPPPTDEAERKRRSIGFNTNRFVQTRLDWIKPLLAGTNRAAPGKKKNVQSYMTYKDSGQKAERMLVLTGGAYPRGGRKPPSITHDTTYALDLDLVDRKADVQQRTAAAGSRELSGLEESLEGFEDPELGRSFVTTFFAEGLSSFDTIAFVPAVAFTQAILITLPSRLIFGDPFVLAAAFGGLMDRLKTAGVTNLPDLFANPEQYLFFDPKVHFNHWHVDWVPSFQRTRVPGWAFAPKPPARWDLDDDFPAFLSRERDFWRPVPIRYRDPRVCGMLQDIVDVNALLGTGVDLTDETTYPAESPLPIGNINDLPTLTSWLDQYFPHWRSP